MTNRPKTLANSEDIDKVRSILDITFPNPRMQIAVLLTLALSVAKEEGLMPGQIAGKMFLDPRMFITELVSLLRERHGSDHKEAVRTALRLAQSCYMIANEPGQIEETLASVSKLSEMINALGLADVRVLTPGVDTTPPV